MSAAPFCDSGIAPEKRTSLREPFQRDPASMDHCKRKSRSADMFYVKNLPVWERWGRGLLGLMLGVAGAVIFGNSASGWVLLALGAVALSTGLIGFCPLCALVGRKLHVKS
jgi:Protein of unknown function (DUF2892)